MEETSIKKVCPPAAELSSINTGVACTEPGCTSLFSNTSNLNMHLFKVHKVGDPAQWKKSSTGTVTQYHCPEEKCLYNVHSKRFFQKLKYLKQHYLKVHAEKSFRCTTCEKGFPTEAALKHHTPICGVKFTCTCNTSYGSNEALMTHVKRTGHVVDKKYKSTGSGKNSQSVSTAITIPVYLAAVALSELSDGCSFKTVVDIGIQTEPAATAVKRVRRISCKSSEHRTKQRGTSIETQTAVPRKKRTRISAETQTSGEFYPHGGGVRYAERQTACGRQAGGTKRRKSMETQTTAAVRRATRDDLRRSNAKKERSSVGKLATLVELAPSNCELDIVVGSSDYWTGQKNSSSTQTSPGKLCDLEMLNGITQTDSDLYGLFESDPSASYIHSQSQAIKLSGYGEDNNSNSSFGAGVLHQSYDLPGTSNGFAGFAAPSLLKMEDILAGERYSFDVNRSCSIETQTEIDSFLLPTECFEEDSVDSFTLSSTIETQTTSDDMEALDQLMYSNMCTQTCNEFLFSDLGFVDIQTQTAGSEYEADLSLVSAETQTRSSSHMETQTGEFREMIAEFEKQNKSEELL